jgi:hypothetical protein
MQHHNTTQYTNPAVAARNTLRFSIFLEVTHADISPTCCVYTAYNNYGLYEKTTENLPKQNNSLMSLTCSQLQDGTTAPYKSHYNDAKN